MNISRDEWWIVSPSFRSEQGLSGPENIFRMIDKLLLAER